MDDQPTVPQESTKAENFVETSDLINNYMAQLEKLKEEMGKFRDMLNAIYENDETYQLHDKAVKEASGIRAKTKKQIQKQPNVADLEGKLKDFKTQIKEYSESLSEYLKLYREQTGATQFETSSGETFEIVYVAKFVKK